MRKVLFIFGQLTDGDIGWLAKNGKRRRAAAGEVLIQDSVPVNTVYIVLEGELSVLQGKQEIARLGAGEIAGEMSFVDARPPSATVKAAKPTSVYAIEKARLQRGLDENVGFAARFYRAVATFLSDRLRMATDPEYDDELDDAVLDNVDRAGARFAELSRQLLDT
jgi:CRP/FNR family cyclic AMP-dependent transcriptional regulator